MGGDSISNKEIIKDIFQERSRKISGHDPWRYGVDLAELTDKVELDWLLENLEIKENNTIIDVGCGTGRHVLLLSELTGAKEVIGCDFVKDNIDFLNQKIVEKGQKNARGICCDATDFSMHVGVGASDIVIAIGVMQYLTTEGQLSDFANCCSEILVDGGHLVIKHPLAFTDSFLLDYYREGMETRYIANYYNLTDLMVHLEENFELLGINRTFTEQTVGDRLAEIERDPRARQMWIHLEKKK